MWKDERAKADALGADLPSAIADAMRSLWVAAVEQGEHVFNEHRQALESDLEALQRVHDDVVTERDAAWATADQLRHELSQLNGRYAELQQQLASETGAKRDALGQVQTLQQEVTAIRADMSQQREAARQNHERLTTEFQATIASRDVAFQTERDKANERVEAAQARMLQETDAAREGLRQAEKETVKLRQRGEEQQARVTELRLEVARHRRELTDAETRLAGLASVIADRDQLALELATVRGQLAGMAGAIQSMEARAVAAEMQLAKTQKRRRTG